MRIPSSFQTKSGAYLCVLLIFTCGLPTRVIAQDKSRPVVISFGQPNIWSLEQAHYLLARMHMQNLDLKATDLTDDALNPNAVNATRINILKSLLEVGVEYDQGVSFQNKQLVRNSQFNVGRRFDLTTKRDNLRPVSTELARDVARLEAERASMEANDESPAAIKLKDAEIAQKKADQAAVDKELSFYDGELKTLAAEPSGAPQSPANSADPFDSKQLPSSVLDKLIEKNADKLLDAAKDPKLNASTILDNHVQMQYEIIAKQLTLLRDEVGPGERLVFLELPQSIYTTPGDADGKMAQVWWHVNGYTRTDEVARLLLELNDVHKQWIKLSVIAKDLQLKLSDKDKACADYKKLTSTEKPTSTEGDPTAELRKSFLGIQCEYETATHRIIESLLRQANKLFTRAEQRGARDTSSLLAAIREVVEIENQNKNSKPNSNLKSNLDRHVSDRRGDDINGDVQRTRTMEIIDDLLPKMSRNNSGAKKTEKEADGTSQLEVNENLKLKDIVEYIRLDERSSPATYRENASSFEKIEGRDVRTIDIIPRQSSLNVNDIQATVKATGIAAAFKFLFGFAGKVNYQRQREQYEQYLHQELYASGFGKGEKDFGWTFGSVPGTKRVAPGVRTTYAVMVVPQEAESIVLSARGCYFPRKDDQPLNYADTGNENWSKESKIERRQCGAEQTFILPVPGGGNDTNQFWVTGIDFNPAKPGEVVTASISGNNFSPQIGVLINGVPLEQTIGLAQPLLRVERDDAAPPCDENYKGICGSLERVDPQQIVVSFKMPVAGTPAITLVAPGRSRSLNTLKLTINGTRNTRLKEADFMFGARAPSSLTIGDLQTFRTNPNSTQVIGLLKGTNFGDDKDEILINGSPVTGINKEFKSSELYRLMFNLPTDENINVTVVQKSEDETKRIVAEKSFANISALKINRVRIISYEPPGRKTDGVLIVRIIGKGLDAGLDLKVRGASAKSEILEVSAGEALLKLVNPEPSVVVTLIHRLSGERLRAVVVRDVKRTTSIEDVAAQ